MLFLSDVLFVNAQLIIFVIGTLVIAGIAAGVVRWWLTRPVRLLASATRGIVQGRRTGTEFDELVSNHLVGQIAQDIQEMSIRLREVDSRDRRFLMSISHELRTPLTAINGHAQALQDGLADDPETRDRSLVVIQREAARLERLVEDIIDLAKLRSNRFTTVTELVHLNVLGDHLTAIFEDQQSAIEIRSDFEHIELHSDGQRILQILRNLVNNSLRYASSSIHVTGERVRNRIRLTVTNDGDPIPADMQDRIFEPFVGQKREGGMGLGLAISRELAWALGGNLRTVPTDTGAIFELTLPLEPPGSGR